MSLSRFGDGALDYAHKKTVHPDVKPENNWVCENAADGAQYKLMDFGIARMMSKPDEPDPHRHGHSVLHGA